MPMELAQQALYWSGNQWTQREKIGVSRVDAAAVAATMLEAVAATLSSETAAQARERPAAATQQKRRVTRLSNGTRAKLETRSCQVGAVGPPVPPCPQAESTHHFFATGFLLPYTTAFQDTRAHVQEIRESHHVTKSGCGISFKKTGEFLVISVRSLGWASLLPRALSFFLSSTKVLRLYL
jgi:hypothetical protein